MERTFSSEHVESRRARVMRDPWVRTCARGLVHLAPSLFPRVAGSYWGTFGLRIGGARLRYRLSPPDPIGESLYWTRCRWQPEVRAFARLARRSQGAILDIGANTGIFSLLAVARAEHPVIAWEPAAEPRRHLVGNLEENGFQDRVEVREAAVGPRPGRQEFFLHDDPTQSSLGDSGSGRSLWVDVERVDDAVSGRVGLVKIDVEGFELGVLQGMTRIIREDAPPIIFEALSEDALRPTQALLEESGYSVSRVSPHDYLAR